MAVEVQEILPHTYAEQIVSSLQKFEIYQLGNNDFFKQHSGIQKLNLQAHQNYAHDTEEWVSALIDTHDKWDVLIYNLITCFNFRTKYLPELMRQLQAGPLQELANKASIFIYAVLFHEAVLVDILAVRAVDQLPQTKYLVELVDYLTNRLDMAVLNRFNTVVTPDNLQNFQDEMEFNNNDLQFKQTITSFSIVRGICCLKAPITVQHQVKSARWHVKIAQILTADPRVFERKLGDQRLQYFEDGEWRNYEKLSERFFKIYKVQGQLLISILGLSMIQDDYSRNECLIFDELKGKLNESMIDQLPQLKDLRVFYERLCFNKLNAQASSELDEYQKKVQEQFGIVSLPERGNGLVVIDVVSTLYAQMENYVRQYCQQRMHVQHSENDQHIVVQQNNDGSVVLSGGRKTETSLTEKQIIEFIASEFISKIGCFNVQTQTLESDYDKVFPVCRVCQQTATYRCSKCRQAWYCSRACQVKDWKEHKQQCGKMAAREQVRKEDGEIELLLRKVGTNGGTVTQ